MPGPDVHAAHALDAHRPRGAGEAEGGDDGASGRPSRARSGRGNPMRRSPPGRGPGVPHRATTRPQGVQASGAGSVGVQHTTPSDSANALTPRRPARSGAARALLLGGEGLPRAAGHSSRAPTLFGSSRLLSCSGLLSLRGGCRLGRPSLSLAGACPTPRPPRPSTGAAASSRSGSTANAHLAPASPALDEARAVEDCQVLGDGLAGDRSSPATIVAVAWPRSMSLEHPAAGGIAPSAATARDPPDGRASSLGRELTPFSPLPALAELELPPAAVAVDVALVLVLAPRGRASSTTGAGGSRPRAEPKLHQGRVAVGDGGAGLAGGPPSGTRRSAAAPPARPGRRTCGSRPRTGRRGRPVLG